MFMYFIPIDKSKLILVRQIHVRLFYKHDYRRNSCSSFWNSSMLISFVNLCIFVDGPFFCLIKFLSLFSYLFFFFCMLRIFIRWTQLPPKFHRLVVLSLLLLLVFITNRTEKTKDHRVERFGAESVEPACGYIL